MNRSSPLVFLGLLLVALSALFLLCRNIQLLLPDCQICLAWQMPIYSPWWVAR